jgi:hypothetical protein
LGVLADRFTLITAGRSLSILPCGGVRAQKKSDFKLTDEELTVKSIQFISDISWPLCEVNLRQSIEFHGLGPLINLISSYLLFLPYLTAELEFVVWLRGIH